MVCVLVGCLVALSLTVYFLPKEPRLSSQDHDRGATFKPASTTPQYVMLAFDGSKSLDLWQQTRDFAAAMNASGTPVHFTYFINAVYFMTRDQANIYQGPHQPRGFTPIGFSDSRADVVARIRQVNAAIAEGHEIGSHAVGHFSGANWSVADWRQEFNAFNNILFYQADTLLPPPAFSSASARQGTTRLALTPSLIHGFRAPELGVSPALYPTLKEFGFTYDVSGVGEATAWPTKDAYGIWHIPLATIELGPNKTPVLAMDYNLWAVQTQNKNILHRGTSEWEAAKKEVVDAFMAYFYLNYKGNRAPVVMGNHFSQWNDGLYWEAMKDFARRVCGLPETHCTTYSDYVRYLDTLPPGVASSTKP